MRICISPSLWAFFSSRSQLSVLLAFAKARSRRRRQEVSDLPVARALVMKTNILVSLARCYLQEGHAWPHNLLRTA